jgi:uncharacterized membrane protein YfcA
VGGIRSALGNKVDFRTAVVFAIPSFIAVFLTRRYLIPMIPDQLGTIAGFLITKDMAIMVFFALIMLVAAISMIRENRKVVTEEGPVQYNYPMIVLEGVVVGMLTGIVGAGGGFLIIPALVLFAKLPMKKAVGTSLIIIAVKSLIGFLGDIGSGLAIDYSFLLLISLIAIIGIFIGIYLSKFISSKKLKVAFGWFVLVMGAFIMINEIFLA